VTCGTSSENWINLCRICYLTTVFQFNKTLRGVLDSHTVLHIPYAMQLTIVNVACWIVLKIISLTDRWWSFMWTVHAQQVHIYSTKLLLLLCMLHTYSAWLHLPSMPSKKGPEFFFKHMKKAGPAFVTPEPIPLCLRYRHWHSSFTFLISFTYATQAATQLIVSQALGERKSSFVLLTRAWLDGKWDNHF
jgi:hypothetical protein